MLGMRILGLALVACFGFAQAGCQRVTEEVATQTAAKDHNHSHQAMPRMKKDANWEKETFLKPGGIYTDSDILANGNVVPSEKYKDLDWPHDDLQPGDKMCPVTMNKADERCQWVVNGKTYTFCCTPCLSKFVGWAKEKPEKIKPPEEYVSK